MRIRPISVVCELHECVPVHTMTMMMMMVMVMASDVACRKGATDDDACVYTARAGGSGGASYHTTYDDDATYDDDDGTEASDFCVDSAWRRTWRRGRWWDRDRWRRAREKRDGLVVWV